MIPKGWNAEKELEFLRGLYEQGAYVELRLPWGFGDIEISPEEILELIHDRYEFLARRMNTTVNNFKEWQRWHEEDFRCRATTRQKRRCKLTAHDVCALMGPELPEFVHGQTDMCSIHRGYY